MLFLDAIELLTKRKVSCETPLVEADQQLNRTASAARRCETRAGSGRCGGSATARRVVKSIGVERVRGAATQNEQSACAQGLAATLANYAHGRVSAKAGVPVAAATPIASVSHFQLIVAQSLSVSTAAPLIVPTRSAARASLAWCIGNSTMWVRIGILGASAMNSTPSRRVRFATEQT